ncbi:MAG: ATP synthase F1 subunit gamma [Candidatus Omnitrophica bacterium]|nr:ATP synthase F1 subunit gamma [Candidatus Omnitrophota bacterium]
MATLNEVKRRIQSVRNTQKITRAMKIVSATKLKKHDRERKASGLFSSKITSVLTSTIQDSYHPKHPLLQGSGKVGNAGIVLVGSDRGLCGAFNANLFRKAQEYIEEQKHSKHVMLVTIGKRTYDFFRKSGHKILFFETNIEKQPRRAFAHTIAKKLVEHFLNGTVDKWSIISNRFASRSSYGYSHDVLLPVTVEREGKRSDSLYICEDDLTTLVEYLVPQYISDFIYKVILESQTAEELSRMLAMDYATENANELIADLTLFYNRTRQQVITKELSEIVGGAEALK